MEVFLNHVLELIASASGASIAVALVVEIVLRLIPSEKPKSVLYAAAKFCELFGKVFTQLGLFLNKVIPQKLKY